MTTPHAATMARRAAAARKTRLKTLSGRDALFFTRDAMRRLAELGRETPVEEAYTIAAVATLLNVTERRVHRLVECGVLPTPIIVGGSPRWRALDIDPVLKRLGKLTPAEKIREDGKQAARDAGARRGPT